MPVIGPRTILGTSTNSSVAWMQLSQVNLSKDKGPIAGFGQVDFTTGITPQTLDATYAEQKGFISAVAGVFVDNADNGFPISLTMSGTQQRLVVPALSQALLPLISKSPEQITFDSPGASVIVKFQFLNFRPGSPLVWGARSGGGSPSAPMFVSDLTIANMTWNNIALGASAAIIPANPAGQLAAIKASPNNANSAWINVGAAAAVNSTIELAPGDSMVVGRPGVYDPRVYNAFGTAPDRIMVAFI